jgi:hypothetical protein
VLLFYRVDSFTSIDCTRRAWHRPCRNRFAAEVEDGGVEAAYGMTKIVRLLIIVQAVINVDVGRIRSPFSGS